MDNGGRPVDRRGFLALAVWGLGAVLAPRAAAAAKRSASGVRRVSFHNLHTDERLTTVYWEDGAYVPAALEEIDAILRDHRTGEIRQMSPGLIELVRAVTTRLGEPGPVLVVSGYRSAATNELLRAADPTGIAAQSRHLTGEAIDVCYDRRSVRKVRDAALALGVGGVGYYPRTGFVHLDIGPPRRW